MSGHGCSYLPITDGSNSGMFRVLLHEAKIKLNSTIE
jgi:hypothetical protein